MDMDTNLRSASPLNYQLPGRVSLWVRSKGSTDPADWKELGNLVDIGLSPLIERLDHFSQRRGARAKDRSEIQSRSATFNFTIDEFHLDNLQLALGSSQASEASETAVKDSKVFDNPGADQDIDLSEEDIDDGTVIVRTASLEEPVTYTVDTDYTVDYAAGTITILGSGALADADPETGVPKIHIYYEKTVETQKFELFDGNEISLEAQFQALTPGGLKYVISMNNAVLKNNGDFTLGDGQDWQKVSLQLEILEDTNGKLAYGHVISEGELDSEV